MRAKIEKRGDKWILETLSWGDFEITSINAHCTAKLEAIYKSHKECHLNFERTEYAGDEYRAHLSIHGSGQWHDDDVACMIREYVPEAEVEEAVRQLLIAGTEQQFVLFSEMLEEER